MRTIWHSLAWKEWHEHKWKLVSIAAILGSITVMAVWHLDRGSYESAQIALIYAIVPLSIFVGLGTAASEQSRATLPFLQSLPVPMWRVALHKLAFGLITIAVSALLCVLVAYLWYKFHYYFGNGANLPYSIESSGIRHFSFGIRNWFVDCALMLTFVGASFLVWAAAIGVNRKDEVSAGAIALTVMAGWIILLVLSWQSLVRQNGPLAQWPEGIAKTLAAMSWSTAPGGLTSLGDVIREDQQYLFLGLISAAVTHTSLAAWYLKRFGKITEREVRSPQVATLNSSRADWLPPPRRYPISAIAWKQFRESGPIVLAGLAGIISVGMVVWLSTRPPERYLMRPDYFAKLFAGVSAVLGFCIAIIVGIGVCLYDVSPQLNTFWRSRPINPDLWFWTKFGIGLLVVMATIYVPLFLVTLPIGLINSWDPDVSFIPALHIAVFATAVMTTCLVRHAVYAAIFSIAVVYLGLLVVLATWLAVGMIGLVDLNANWWEPTDVQVVTGLLITFVVSTIIAWLAVRNDWGWKSRY